MSVSRSPGGSKSLADPRSAELNASRLSHLSTASTGSAITLGGVDYHVGSRVGKTGAFVIGDPKSFDPRQSWASVHSSEAGGSNKGLVHATSIQQKGYGFEEWNWQAVRLTCLVMVCAVMIALLAAVIGVTVEHRMMCGSPFEWYQGSTVYHIPVPYFSDSDGNDVGDIRGMLNKLDYVEFLNTKVVLLSQLLPSDQPYWDSYISFMGVDSRLGLLSDFDAFIQTAHQQSQLKILLELSVVYTSVNHLWFIDSVKESSSYHSDSADFYIWRQQPDLSLGSSWTKNILRDMYYLNMNDSSKPLLNWNSPKLLESLVSILDFWLLRGIDGFVMRNMEHLFGDQQRISEVIQELRTKSDEYNSQFNRKILALGNRFLDKLSSAPVSIQEVMSQSVDLVIVPVVMGTNDTYSLQAVLKHGLTYSQKTKGPWTCWEVLGLNGVDVRYVTSVQMYTVMLPGTPMIAAGQEIGRFYLSEKIQPQLPPKPMLWRNDNIYPYQPGMPLNETTIGALRTLMAARNEAYAVREDSLYEEGASDVKTWNYDMRRINGDMMVLERKYKRKPAYYYMANYHTTDLLNIDLSYISAYGDVVTDTTGKYQSPVNLQQVHLRRGQALIFSIIQ